MSRSSQNGGLYSDWQKRRHRKQRLEIVKLCFWLTTCHTGGILECGQYSNLQKATLKDNEESGQYSDSQKGTSRGSQEVGWYFDQQKATSQKTTPRINQKGGRYSDLAKLKFSREGGQ